MASTSKSYIIEIPKGGYGYGFDFKDEGCPFKKYAVIGKVNSTITDKLGLKIGDKVIGINDMRVAGKDYATLKYNMRQSGNNPVKLEILNGRETWLLSPDTCSISSKKMAWEYTKKILVPVGSIREKIRFFQNDEKNVIQKKILNHSRSNSCGCIPESCSFDNKPKYSEKLDSNSLSSIIYSMQNDNTLISDTKNDIVKPISQEPFFDDSIRVPCGVIEMPNSVNHDRVLINKSSEHIMDPVFQSMPESFETNTLISPAVPKIEISNFQNNPSFSTSAICTKLSPVYPENLSRSSINIFEDVSIGWQGTGFTSENHGEFISMTNINSENKKDIFPQKKLIKQESILESIPIKLRILQFKEKLRSKSWKDYTMRRTQDGVCFRKREKSMRHDKTKNFVIDPLNVNRFAIESPHKRQKSSTGVEIQTTEFCMNKYELMTSDNNIHLKFYFNSAIFQDSQSSCESHASYNEIIGLFKPEPLHKKTINYLDAHDSRRKHINVYFTLQPPVHILKVPRNAFSYFKNTKNCLPEPISNTIHLSKSHGSFTTINEIKPNHYDSSSNDLSLSFKSTSKSSVENLPNNNSTETISATSKNIFKQAIDKIKPEKKTKSYEVFTGTKAEFEEFKKQLEGGILPVELDSSDETGTNFNRFVYEVPRMIKYPKIPMIIYLCTEIVEKVGLKCEGIYRISGNQRVIRTLSTTLNKNLLEIDHTLQEWSNVHAICGTLKMFLRKLKENLIPADLSHVLAYSCKAVDCDNPNSLSKTLMDIRYHLSSYKNSLRRKAEIDLTRNFDDQADCRWQTLQYLLKHLSKVVSYRQFNSMDEHALSVCFNPVVMESWQKNINDIKADNEIMIKALELILIHQSWLFVDWNSHIDSSRSTELMADAYQYAKKFIENKYDISIKHNSQIIPLEIDVNINNLVYKIISQATTEFGEKKRIERRHSSHVPGQKCNIEKDEIDSRDNSFIHRNSKVTEALDLFTCPNILKTSEKVPQNDENKKYKLTYIVSSESLSEYDESNYKAANVTLRESVSKKNNIDEYDCLPYRKKRYKSDENLSYRNSLYFE